MKRIGVLQVLQESNSLNPILTERVDFERYGAAFGDEVLGRFGNVGEIDGFTRGLKDWATPCEPVGVLRLLAWPSGPLSRSCLDWILRSLEASLIWAGNLDGLLCSLHGSMVGVGEDDVEGRLLAAMRRIVGPAIPIVASLDLHASVTLRMTELADVLVAYHTSPHVDQVETGIRSARALERVIRGSRPRASVRRIPMISVAEAQSTGLPPLMSIFERLAELESAPGVLSAALLMTQGWLDIPALGWSAMVVTDGDADRGDALAEELASEAWRVRERLTVDLLPPGECVARALEHEGSPVVIADGADATNSGAGGDSVHLLAELLRHRIPGGALTIMVDPAAVAEAHRVGERGAFNFAVGGKRDRVFSSPLPLSGSVLRLGVARYVLSGHGGHNLPVDMGRCATVRTRDVTLLLVEAPGPGSTPHMYRSAGLEPRAHKIVVVKSPAGFRAEYGPFASLILLADCPGCASPRYERLPYRRISRPRRPIDGIRERSEAAWASSWRSGGRP